MGQSVSKKDLAATYSDALNERSKAEIAHVARETRPRRSLHDISARNDLDRSPSPAFEGLRKASSRPELKQSGRTVSDREISPNVRIRLSPSRRNPSSPPHQVSPPGRLTSPPLPPQRSLVKSLTPCTASSFSEDESTRRGREAFSPQDDVLGGHCFGARRRKDHYRSVSRPTKQEVSLSGLRGLNNLGNTCYMNCALQSLAATKTLRSFLNGEERLLQELSRRNTKSSLLLYEGIKIMQAIWDQGDAREGYVRLPMSPATTGTVNTNGLEPARIKRALDIAMPQFVGYEQHDAQEFLSAFLDVLQEELRDNPAEEPQGAQPDIDSSALRRQSEPEIADDFWSDYKKRHNPKLIRKLQGLMAQRVSCNECREFSIKFEPFASLSVPVVDSGELLRSLDECLTCQMAPEFLLKDDRWNCPRCKKAQEAERRVTIHKLPKALIVHLKRFTYSNGRFEKLNHHISVKYSESRGGYHQYFPYRDGTKLYRLYAVINHNGRFGGGHYSAFCLHPDLQCWFHFDDNCVSWVERPQDSVVTSTAYVLFFEQAHSNVVPVRTPGTEIRRSLETRTADSRTTESRTTDTQNGDYEFQGRSRRSNSSANPFEDDRKRTDKNTLDARKLSASRHARSSSSRDAPSCAEPDISTLVYSQRRLMGVAASLTGHMGIAKEDNHRYN